MAIRRAAAKIQLHPVRVLLGAAAVLLIAVLAMPTVLNIAAKSLNKLPVHSRISVISRQLQPPPGNKPNTVPSAAGSVAAKAFSGGPNMSTQVYKYRDPVVFNARDKHTGEYAVCSTAEPSVSWAKYVACDVGLC